MNEQIKAIIQMLVTLLVTLAGIFGYSLAEEQAQQICDMFKGFETKIEKDLEGVDRIVIAQKG